MFLVIFCIVSYWFVTFRFLYHIEVYFFVNISFRARANPRFQLQDELAEMLKNNGISDFSFNICRKLFEAEPDDLITSQSRNIEEKILWIRWSTLRVPGGNQVDSLPPAWHTETVAKPARVGPRTTPVLSNMKKLLWNILPRKSVWELQ